jgi:hypothetical protein
MLDKIKMYRAGLGVTRLHNMPHISHYDNGSHSANAALLAHEICVANDINSAAVVLYMLKHDLHEFYTGDIPAYVKTDNQPLGDAIHALEMHIESSHKIDLPVLSYIECDVAKFCDLAELGFYCIKEKKLGNTNLMGILRVVTSKCGIYTSLIGVSQIVEYFDGEL